MGIASEEDGIRELQVRKRGVWDEDIDRETWT